MKQMLPLALVALLSISAAAQTQDKAKPAAPANPITTSVKAVYDSAADDVMAGAQKMPEANYFFKPTPEVRNFGQLVGHVADTNFLLCAAAIGENVPPKNFEATKTSKADLIAALKESVSYCNKAYDSLTDAKAAEMIKFGDQDLARIAAISVATAHSEEHYGNMVTYMRLKGIVPPTTVAQQAPPAK